VKFYADGSLVHTEELEDHYPVWLPRDIDEAGLWTVDVDSDGTVYEVVLYPRRSVQVDGPHVALTRNRGPIVPWAGAVYTWKRPNILRSVLMDGKQNVTLKMYLDDSVAATKSETLTPGVEFAYDNASVVCNRAEFYCDGNDHTVHQLSVFGEEEIPVGPQGTTLRGRTNWRRIRLRQETPAPWRMLDLEAVGGDVTYRLSADGVTVATGTTARGRIRVPRNAADAEVLEVDLGTS